MDLKEKITESNPYSIFLKVLGVGFICIGIAIILLIEDCNMITTATGMSFGVIFFSFGEIINLLQKIYDKQKEQKNTNIENNEIKDVSNNE